MSRYPQAIPGKMGERCPYCGAKKYCQAKLCRRCEPTFSSFSKAQEWADKNASGPCTMAFRQYGYAYTAWPARVIENGAAA
jgi:hypothetical protein